VVPSQGSNVVSEVICEGISDDDDSLSMSRNLRKAALQRLEIRYVDKISLEPKRSYARFRILSLFGGP
jgi:hypothetical protein